MSDFLSTCVSTVMNPIPFKEWLELLNENFKLEGTLSKGRLPEAEIESISINSRTIKPGAVYFALDGQRFDGHDFVKSAFEKGAICCVVKKSWQADQKSAASRMLVRVADPLDSLQQLAKNYRSNYNIPVLAITGTNGKTTTKEMIAAVLAARYQIIKTIGNLNNHIGLPLSLMQLDKKSEIAVLEMGANHSGEIKTLCDIAAPTHGLITNVGSGHLEFFGSVNKVAKAKAELFDSLPSDGGAFVNLDDERIKKIKRHVSDQVTFGFQPEADIKGQFLEMNDSGCAGFRLQDTVDIQLQTPGRHKIYNALAAAAAGIYWQVPIKNIADVLANFSSYSKRMELYQLGNTTILLDAYNSNPDSLTAALESLNYLAQKREGRAIAVLGDMLELGDYSENAHQRAGEQAAHMNLDALFLYGDFSLACKQGYINSKGKYAQIYSDKTELAQGLFDFIKNGDLILIKGSRGMAMETVWQALQQLAG